MISHLHHQFELMINKIYLLLIAFLFLYSCKNEVPVDPEVEINPYYSEPHRPQFHFSPEKKWMNDPNGMVYFEGEYHLFYQHYPDSTVWGPMHWGHAVSTDLVHWEHLPIALYPDSLGYIFSGSAVIDWKNTTGLGTDDQPPMIAIFTHHLMEGEKAGTNDFQYQSIAWSNDKGRTWTKYAGNPVISNPGIKDFRDPKVIWDESSEQWVMVFAAGDHIKIYGSTDLKEWKYLSDFGKQWGTHAGVWECPDLFPIEVGGSGETKWVLLLSINPGGPNGGSATQYFVGDFNGKTFNLDSKFVKEVADEKAVWLDYGRDNYAGVTFSDIPDSDGRRIFIGWMSNWDYAQVVPTDKWRSAMTIPRQLKLVNTNAGYRVISSPVKELKKLRSSSVSIPNQTLQGNKKIENAPFSNGCMEIELEVKVEENGNFGLTFYNDKGEEYSIGFNALNNHFYSDRLRSGNKEFSKLFAKSQHIAPRFSKSETVKLHIYIDRSSIELFADEGESVLTDIFFPSNNFSNMYLFSHNGKSELLNCELHGLQSIW